MVTLDYMGAHARLTQLMQEEEVDGEITLLCIDDVSDSWDWEITVADGRYTGFIDYTGQMTVHEGS